MIVSFSIVLLTTDFSTCSLAPSSHKHTYKCYAWRARNHCIALPTNASSEWFRHSAGEAPTQCEVPLLVERDSEKNKPAWEQ